MAAIIWPRQVPSPIWLSFQTRRGLRRAKRSAPLLRATRHSGPPAERWPPRTRTNIQTEDEMKGLENKVAVVTGGGQGIGRALSLRLAEEGCKVAIFDLNPAAGAETAKLAGAGTIRAYTVDVTDYGSIQTAVGAAERELGPIWALVNNAGWDKPLPFLATDRALWDKIININLYGSLKNHHIVAPLMVGRGGGRVID